MNETIDKLKELLENDKKTIEENYKEIERLNSIIKEVREKIRSVQITYLGLRSGKTFITRLLLDILEILDKENKL